MLARILLPDDRQLRLETCLIDARTLHVIVAATQTEAVCPDCESASMRVHSRYERTLADLPCTVYAVKLHWTVRRFFCDNSQCSRVTFSEQVESVAERYARKTRRLVSRQRQIAFEVGGEMGARLMRLFDLLRHSADTLLRLIRSTPEPPIQTPRVLGIDDWALRKGQRYGTILVDLENHRPIDLLPDRNSDTVAEWLQEHPGVEIITRDRSGEYANGARQGAPDAVQVADRFHLLLNVTDALRRMFDRHQKVLAAVAKKLADDSQNQALEAKESLSRRAEAEVSPPGGQQRCRPPSRAEQRFAEVKALQAQGWSKRSISRALHINRKTVRRYWYLDEYPQRVPSRQGTSLAQPYLGYLQSRWQLGCCDRKQLLEEIRTQGFTGSYSSLWRATRHFPSQRNGYSGAGRAPETVRRLSARQAAWLLTRDPEDMDAEDNRKLELLREESEVAAVAQELTQSFREMLRDRKAGRFDAWLQDANDSTIPEFKRLAGSLKQDYDAVKAALSLEWSNGQVEGQVHRLKLVKRQMYGRANFDLLRRRVLGMPMPP